MLGWGPRRLEQERRETAIAREVERAERERERERERKRERDRGRPH